jgi:hypothetical protein
MNRASEGEVPDQSLDKIIAELPRVESEGTWDEKKQDYIVRPACSALRKRLAQGDKLTDAQWRKALLNTGVIRVRDRWPESEEFALSMRKPCWLGVAEIRMKPHIEGLKEAKVGLLFESTCGTFSNWMYQAALCQRLGRLPSGKQKVGFDVTVERGDESTGFGRKVEAETPPPGILWRGEMSFDVDVVRSADDCIPAVEGEAVDKAVCNSLGVAFDVWYRDGKEQPTTIFVIDPNVEDYPLLADTALSLKIEILKKGRVVDECHLTASDYDRLALAASVSKGDRKSIAFCAIGSVPAVLKEKKEERKDWSIRVSGTSKDVIYLWDAKRRWRGSIEVGIDVLIEREQEKTKGKERVWMWTPTLR